MSIGRVRTKPPRPNIRHNAATKPIQSKGIMNPKPGQFPYFALVPRIPVSRASQMLEYSILAECRLFTPHWQARNEYRENHESRGSNFSTFPNLMEHNFVAPTQSSDTIR